MNGNYCPRCSKTVIWEGTKILCPSCGWKEGSLCNSPHDMEKRVEKIKQVNLKGDKVFI